MSDLSVGTLRGATSFMRSVAISILVVYTANVISPGAVAMAREVEHQSAINAQQAADRADFGKALTEVQEHLRVLAGRPDAAHRQPSAEDRKRSKTALRASRANLQQLDHDVQAQFDSTERLIRDKQLAPVILQRHAAAVARYHRELAALSADLDGAINASDEATSRAKAESAFKRLDSQNLGHTQRQVDPNHLPHSVLKADPTHRPRVTSKEFLAAGLFDNPRLHLASINPFDISHLPSASDPAYLAATTEVVLTPDIVAQASQLNGNPVAIYNWVRNNVQWQPTWGAVQDASMTLATQRGNAFDIASLTIALLRASGIPARYVHGTIDVPADQFKNWAGGFQNITAALDFASAGGIPITAITAGGQISKIRMEHVWVEAAVDFVPSRGAINKSADTWVALDPSFKQVQVSPGLDPVKISGVDPGQVATTYLNSGTVNQTEGWISGLNPATLQPTAIRARQNAVTYVQTNLPDATLGDVIGGIQIVAQTRPVLPTALPSHIVAVGARYATLPAQLEQQITFALGEDLDGSPLNPQTFPWPQLNSQQVTLSFLPATQADQDVINSLLPPGGVTDVSQLPTSIPAYLVQVIPQLKVNGTVAMSGPPMTLGQDLTFVFDPIFVSSGEQHFSYNLAAGSYLAVAVVAGGVNPVQLDAIQSRISATVAALNSNDPAQLSALTRERLFGDLFQGGVLGYYGQYMGLGYIAGLRASGHHELAAGIGSFGYEPKVDSVLGVPRSLKVGGAVFNVPIVNIVGYDGTDPAGSRNFTMSLGALSSALEHAVPGQVFNSATNFGDAVSAVEALKLATQAGQRIYQLTAATPASTLALLHHDPNAMAEISAALAAGKTVITHTDPITVPGWTGSGYVILDPDTGSGAWKISGGANGGYYTLVGLALGLVAGIAAVVAGPFLAGAVGVFGFLAQQYLGLTLSKDVFLDFKFGRLFATVSGAALAVILGEYVLISLSPLFVLGFVFLALSIFVEVILDIISDCRKYC